MSATASTKFNASGMLWWNAALFADLCKQLETEHQADFFSGGEWTPKERVMREHRALTTARPDGLCLRYAGTELRSLGMGTAFQRNPKTVITVLAPWKTLHCRPPAGKHNS